MKSVQISVLFLSMLGVSGAMAADAFKMIHTQDLATMLNQKTATPYIVDANNVETRTKYGVIPGSHLLDSSRTYDVSKALPADKSKALVFYCANKECMASHQAANRASKAGYANVSVLSDGIMGWKASGNPTVDLKTLKN